MGTYLCKSRDYTRVPLVTEEHFCVQQDVRSISPWQRGIRAQATLCHIVEDMSRFKRRHTSALKVFKFSSS